jgi:hypothetical protein
MSCRELVHKTLKDLGLAGKKAHKLLNKVNAIA